MDRLVVVSHSTAGGGSAQAACSILGRCEINEVAKCERRLVERCPARETMGAFCSRCCARDYIFSVSKIYSLDYRSISKRGYWKMER